MSDESISTRSSRSTCTRTRRSSRDGEDRIPPELREAQPKYFGEGGMPTVDDVAAYYRERKMAAVIFTVDAESLTGQPPVAERGDRRRRRRATPTC